MRWSSFVFLLAIIKTYKSGIFNWIVTPTEAESGFAMTVIEFWLKDLDFGMRTRLESGFSCWQQKLRRWKFVQSFLGGARNDEYSLFFLVNECDVTGIEYVVDDVTGGMKSLSWHDVGQLSNWTDSLELPIWKWTSLKNF